MPSETKGRPGQGAPAVARPAGDANRFIESTRRRRSAQGQRPSNERGLLVAQRPSGDSAMSLLDDFVRVVRQHPCPFCEKPEWCLLSRDNPTAILLAAALQPVPGGLQ